MNRALPPILFALAAVLVSGTSAQVSAVGPFTGSHSDGFESQTGHSGGQPCLVGRAFQDTADLCSTTTILRSSGWSFMCTIFPRTGNAMCAANIGYAFFTFDAPVQAFGGYFGTNGAQGTVEVRFFDAGGTLIDVVAANVPADCNWYWNGWQTQGAAIARVEIENSVHGGCHVMLDDMEIDALPPGPIGTSYCGPAIPNTTGQPGVMTVLGSTTLADNDVELVATGLPPGQFGYFLVGATQGFFNPPGSNGFLCMTGNIGRYNDTAEIIMGPTGNLVIDLGAVPVNPPTATVPGDTWNFQCWYRDVGPTNNFTDAVEVTFL